ncbi:MAG: hypothetical protein AB7I50_18765 [Vicinamibacterales bacterium]
MDIETSRLVGSWSRFLSGAIAAATLTGPVVTVLLAEAAGTLSFSIPVPLWDAYLLSLAINTTMVSVCIIAVSTPALLVRRARRVVVKVIASVGIVWVATVSAVLSWPRVINVFYDRYQSALMNATIWAPGFSETAFARIAVGMSSDEVVHALGRPLRLYASGKGEVWAYSQIGHYQRVAEKGFHERSVIMERNHVVRIVRQYQTAE